MSDYDDYRKDEEQFFRDLEALPEIREEGARERRLHELAARRGVPRSAALKDLARVVNVFSQLYPGASEEELTAKAHELLKFATKKNAQPSNCLTTRRIDRLKSMPRCATTR